MRIITFSGRGKWYYVSKMTDGGYTSDFKCGDSCKGNKVKQATLPDKRSAAVLASFLVDSGLTTYVKYTAAGNKVEWRCRTSWGTVYTFRVARNCRYEGFVWALEQALAHGHIIPAVVSLAYFFSKYEHPDSSYGKYTLRCYEDMLDTHSRYGLMFKKQYEALLGDEGGEHISYQSLYEQAWNASNDISELVKQWKNS